ncbi:hypothetical protein DY000_02057323 [Brassica cretica]|uniref:Uncharacterized protein n=1 Tax=Brassica cretica TaxID=69181 RepID=A0ABQ7AMN9_BRACR|nr:hypothetical protein DY000_02057323 [Brassica cretica]
MADYHYVIPIPADIAQQKKRKWMEVKSLAGMADYHYVIPIPPDIAQQKKRKWMEVKSLAEQDNVQVYKEPIRDPCPCPVDIVQAKNYTNNFKSTY